MGLNNEVYNRYAKVEIRVIVPQMMYKGGRACQEIA